MDPVHSSSGAAAYYHAEISDNDILALIRLGYEKLETSKSPSEYFDVEKLLRQARALITTEYLYMKTNDLEARLYLAQNNFKKSTLSATNGLAQAEKLGAEADAACFKQILEDIKTAIKKFT